MLTPPPPLLGFVPIHAQKPQPRVEEKIRFDAHTKVDKKDLDMIARKNGFKTWQKLIQKATQVVNTFFKGVKLVSQKGLDVVEKDCNWLGVILHHTTQMLLPKAIEKALELRQMVLTDNFAIDYSTAYKATINDVWRNVEIESVSHAEKPLFGLESLYYLASSLIAFCLDKKRTDAHQTLFGLWDYESEFWDKDQTSDAAFLQMEKVLIDAFSENVSADIVLSRIKGETAVNWHKDRKITAFYGYFNKYCTWLDKPQAIRQRMVFTAVFYFIGYIDNKSEMQHCARFLTHDWQKQMIDSLLIDWCLN